MLRRSFLRTAGVTQLRDVAKAHLKDIEEGGLTKHERVITSPQSGSITVSTSGSKPILNFCANNYLGLSDHKDIVAAAHKGLDERGFGMSSVRFICGTQDVHKTLEHELADFVGAEDAICYPSCFDANGGVFETLLTADDAVISDSLNHASIIDGIRLCKAERHRYAHLNLGELEEKLIQTQNKRIRLIATDGVFSMDGDVAPLDKIVALAEKYNANIFVDDAHGTGVMGAKGRGTPSLFGVEKHIDVLNSTLGKAMGGASGGFSAGMKELVFLQRQRGRPYLFSNSIAPPVAYGSLQAIRMLKADSTQLDVLRRNTEHFRSGMKKAGFKVGGHDTCPIAPVMIGDARTAAIFADKMLEEGIYVIAFSYPVVPKGQARIRVQLSSAHTQEQVKQCVDAFVAARDRMPKD